MEVNAVRRSLSKAGSLAPGGRCTAASPIASRTSDQARSSASSDKVSLSLTLIDDTPVSEVENISSTSSILRISSSSGEVTSASTRAGVAPG